MFAGVKFRMVGTHMNLEIRVNEYDFVSGKVDPVSEWISNDNTEFSTQKRCVLLMIYNVSKHYFLF